MNLPQEYATQLHEPIADFEHVIATAVKAKNAGQGVDCDRRARIADTLWLRGILTSLSIHQLVNPKETTGIPSLAFPDFTSISVLARSVIEAHLTLHNLALAKRSDQELELRLLWWDWHLVSEKIRARDTIGSTNAHLASLNQKHSKLRNQLSAHPMKDKIPKDLASRFSAGKPPIRPLFETWRQIASEAGIDPGQFDSQYQGLSAAAHSEPWIIEMLQRHDPRTPEILASLKLSIRNAAVYLGRMTEGLASLNSAVSAELDERFHRFMALWRALHATPFSQIKT